MLFTLCVYYILNALVPGLSYATNHLCKWLECRWSNRRRNSYELGTCWSSFLGLQTLLQEAFSNQSEESSYIHIIFPQHFGVAVHEQVRAKSLADEIAEIGSFTVTFRHAEVVSAGIWLAEIGHALKRTMVCFTDLNFIDDDDPPGTNISHRKALLKMIFLFPR